MSGKNIPTMKGWERRSWSQKAGGFGRRNIFKYDKYGWEPKTPVHLPKCYPKYGEILDQSDNV